MMKFFIAKSLKLQKLGGQKENFPFLDEKFSYLPPRLLKTLRNESPKNHSKRPRNDSTGANRGQKNL